MMKKTIIVAAAILVAAGAVACFCFLRAGRGNNTTAGSAKQQTPVAPASQNPSNEPENDWLYVPGERVGPITAQTTETELKRIFGAQNVVREEQLTVYSGEEVPASIVYGGTDREFRVIWSYDEPYLRPATVWVYSPGSRWHTREGVRMGTTLDELNRLNGKPFSFNGFDWDEGGMPNDSWRDGKLKGLLLRLEATVGYEDSGSFFGPDVSLDSADPRLPALRIAVRDLWFDL